MDTGKTVRGGADLVFDMIGGTTRIVEDMHRNIAATPWPLGAAPGGAAQGIAGSVYSAIRGANHLARGFTRTLLAGAAPLLDRGAPPGPHREAVVAALNGVCGDHFENSGNPLAIPMQLRVFLPRPDDDGRTTGSGKTPFSGLFETARRPVEIHPRPQALVKSGFAAGRHILLLVHGLCMNDREWTADQHNHAEALAAKFGYSPVYALYNSGRHISTNGRELCAQVSGLLDAWPTPVASITLIGFSMGGLVVRSALHTADTEGHAWRDKVDKAVYIGTPHHGAALERGGFWLQKGLTRSPYTAPLAAPGRMRSAGITDLRHGNVCDDDWQHHDAHEDHSDRRRPIPLAAGIQHYALAGTLSAGPGSGLGRLLGDGLVHPASATGRHADPDFALDFPREHTRIIYDVGHLAMLGDRRVLDQLQSWLRR